MEANKANSLPTELAIITGKKNNSNSASEGSVSLCRA